MIYRKNNEWRNKGNENLKMKRSGFAA